MKKLITLLMFGFLTLNIYSQNQVIVSNIYGICDSNDIEDPYDAPIGSYFKDVNNTFAPFIGVWKYINSNEIIIFKIEKVTQFYDAEFQVYEDFLVGNYNYSQDGGATLIVERISPTLLNETSMENSMYSPCVEDFPNKLGMTFRDALTGNNKGNIKFEFLPGSTIQMQVSLYIPEGSYGYLEGTPPPNFDFSLPTSFVVTKQ